MNSTSKTLLRQYAYKHFEGELYNSPRYYRGICADRLKANEVEGWFSMLS